VAATCGFDFERRINAPAAEVRRVVGESLRSQGFKVTAELMTRIEAKRGSLVGSSLLQRKSMSMSAEIEVASEPDGTTLSGRLADSLRNLGKTWGINSIYRDVFAEVSAELDKVLARLDPASAQGWVPGRFWSRSGEVPVLDQANVATGKLSQGAVAKASEALSGKTDTTPSAWKGIDSVTFRSSAGVAVMSLAEVQAQLGVAVMVVGHPGSVPPTLTRDVEVFASGLERRLTAAAGHPLEVELSEDLRPTFEFLVRQASIRAELPMRQLHTCTTCRLEKITNPVYTRLAARNEKIGDIVAGVGATITSGGISPTFVLGQVFKLKKLEPDYVCSRCQGLEADERVVTFCPECGELQKDVVLRLCPKCGFDFETRAPKESPWSPIPEVAVASAAVEAAGTSASAQAEPPMTEPGEGAVSEVETPAAAPPGPAVSATPVAPAPPAPPSAVPAPPAPPPVDQASLVPPGAVPAPPAPPPVDQASAISEGSAQPLRPPPWAALATPPPPPPAASTFAVVWRSPFEVPLGPAPVGSGGGKVCQSCGREYPSLWRLVVQAPNGYIERFVCGSTPACQMRSLVTARRV